MKVYAGIDLHANNNYLGVVDEDGKRLFGKRICNDPGMILEALDPVKKELAGAVVESTFNWYWLVDGLMEAGYEVKLVNPAAVKKYEGLKHQDDESDAY